MKIFCDLDGVLADFLSAYAAVSGTKPRYPALTDWSLVGPDFYKRVKMMPGAARLWSALKTFDPTILTGTHSSVPNLGEQKRAWVKKFLGTGIKVICTVGEKKQLYAKPGDILIDNDAKHEVPWVAAGGRFILYRSADQVIDELRGVK